MFLHLSGQAIIVPGCKDQRMWKWEMGKLRFGRGLHRAIIMLKCSIGFSQPDAAESLSQRIQVLLQIHLGLDQYIPCLAALVRAYNTGRFELIHKTPCTVISQFHPSL